MQRPGHRVARFGELRDDSGFVVRYQQSGARRPSRAAVALFAISAASSALLTPRSLVAQTWVNSNVGLWSNGSNWVGGVAPASGAATQLRFNATGSDSYTASNDIAPPFLLNTVTFNNTGSGLITLDTNPLSFGGANPAIQQLSSGAAQLSQAIQLGANTTVNFAGAGTVTLAGAVTSVPGATGTSGSSLIQTGSGNLVLQGGTTGGNLYGLRVNTGSLHIAAGSYTLASTQRGSDPFDSINDGGFWGLVVGNTASQTGRLSMTGGTILAQNAMVGNAADSHGVLTLSGAGTGLTLTGTNQGRLGTNFGHGTINILNGASATVRRVDLVRNAGGTGRLSIDGAGSKLTATQELNVPLSSGNATLSVSNGGTVNLTNANFFLAAAIDPSFNPVSSIATATVTGASSGITASGDGISTGAMLIGFGGPGVSAAGTLNISSGAVVNSASAFVGDSNGTGAIVVDGSTAQLNNTFQAVVSSTTASSISLTNGGKWTNAGDTFTANASTDRAVLNVSGNGALANLSGVLVLSRGGSSTLNISGGGELRTSTLFAADNDNSQANIFVSGTNSKLSLANQGIISDGNGATANMTISAGANLNASAALFLSSPVGAVSNVNITGTGSSFTSTGPATQLHVGGNAGVAGGTASFGVVSGASATVSGPAIVYTRGTLTVGVGTTNGAASFTSPAMTVNGTVSYGAGTFQTSGTLAVGGQILLTDAGREANGTTNWKKTLQAGVLSMTASAVIDLNDNDAIFTNTSLATVQGRIAAARNNGLWDSPGITSTKATIVSPANTTLGAIVGADYFAAQGAGASFNGRAIAASDVLVKYTYYGDTDFNGVVNFDDYARTDNGFNNNQSGWFNGDFDYNGIVNFDDYSLLDLSFNTQAFALNAVPADQGGPTLDRDIVGAPLPANLARAGIAPTPAYSALRNANLNAVPEPSVAGAAAMILFAATARRHRRRA